MNQPTFADLDYESKKRKTRREKFLERMDGLIPWEELEERIRPFYPKAGRGRRPYELSVMLRIHCVQLFYNLSDPGMEDMLYEVESVRRFVGLRLWTRASASKNRAKERDPEMHQTKKGNEWHFGMKVHIGVDSQTGVVHSMTTTSANVHDLTELPRLLHGGESQVWGDAGYQGVDKRPGNRGLDVEWQVAMRPGQRRKLEPGSPEAVSEKRKASVRAKVEHPFLYIKRHFGYAKVRYRGLSKNTQRLMTLLGFANLMRAEQYLAA